MDAILFKAWFLYSPPTFSAAEIDFLIFKPNLDSYNSIVLSIKMVKEKNRVIINAKFAIILLGLSALRVIAKYIGTIKPNTLLEAIINALIIANETGIIFFLNDPSRRKKVKKNKI